MFRTWIADSMDVSVSPAESQPSLWTPLAKAIRGSYQDYASGSLNRAIFLLAVPMLLEMVLESLSAVVDVHTPWSCFRRIVGRATRLLQRSLISLVSGCLKSLWRAGWQFRLTCAPMGRFTPS